MSVSAEERVCFYEVASLYGTTYPPSLPGWDPTEKTRELAEGARDQHGLLIEDGTGYSAKHFLQAIRELAGLPPRDAPDIRTFYQWLWEGTLGRLQSVGTVEYTTGAEEGKKAREVQSKEKFFFSMLKILRSSRPVSARTSRITWL